MLLRQLCADYFIIVSICSCHCFYSNILLSYREGKVKVDSQGWMAFLDLL